MAEASSQDAIREATKTSESADIGVVNSEEQSSHPEMSEADSNGSPRQSKKRRASAEDAEDDRGPDAKRQRADDPSSSKDDPSGLKIVSQSHNGTETSPKPPSEPSRPSPPSKKPVDERKRSKRLFGSILSTLSQIASNDTSTRRRLEIEERKRSEAASRSAELAERQEARLVDLRRRRRRRQIEIEERDLKIRHENMRSCARFLRTETEPRVYFRPWELSAEEKARVKRQIENVEEDIDRESEGFEERRRKWRKELEREEEDERLQKGRDERDERNGTEVQKMDGVEDEQRSKHSRKDASSLSHEAALPDNENSAKGRPAQDDSTEAQRDEDDAGVEEENGEDTLMY